MSMLAERKQKQRWSLNPRGKHWSEDSSKFGQKLLERMGWKHGKGLGANEDGLTEHVKLNYKNDQKGMGYKESEQWTEHEDHFTKLLNTLNGDLNNISKNDEVKVSSLHEKAENVKTRINYHKFTKGKDLSRYSEKDLANIFGRKNLKKEVKDKVEKSEDDVKEKEGNLINKGSLADYFKKKLPQFGKFNGGIKIGNNGVLTKESSDTESEKCFGFGFNNDFELNGGKKRGLEEIGEFPVKKKVKIGNDFSSSIMNGELENDVDGEKGVKKKKKKLKLNENECEKELIKKKEINCDEVINEKDLDGDETFVKKKKKSKKNNDNSENDEEIMEIVDITSKKKKKRKEKDIKSNGYQDEEGNELNRKCGDEIFDEEVKKEKNNEKVKDKKVKGINITSKKQKKWKEKDVKDNKSDVEDKNELNRRCDDDILDKKVKEGKINGKIKDEKVNDINITSKTKKKRKEKDVKGNENDLNRKCDDESVGDLVKEEKINEKIKDEKINGINITSKKQKKRKEKDVKDSKSDIEDENELNRKCDDEILDKNVKEGNTNEKIKDEKIYDLNITSKKQKKRNEKDIKRNENQDEEGNELNKECNDEIRDEQVNKEKINDVNITSKKQKKRKEKDVKGNEKENEEGNEFNRNCGDEILGDLVKEDKINKKIKEEKINDINITSKKKKLKHKEINQDLDLNSSNKRKLPNKEVEEDLEPPIKKKKSKKSKNNPETDHSTSGIINPGFDPTFNSKQIDLELRKRTKVIIEYENDNVPNKDSLKSSKKSKSDKGIVNPSFEDLVDTKNIQNGIVNPALNVIEEDSDLTLNVVTTPILKSERSISRSRKSVRFSKSNEEHIIPNNYMRERNELFDINTLVVEESIKEELKNNDSNNNKGFINNGFDIRAIDKLSFFESGIDNPCFQPKKLEDKVNKLSQRVENFEAKLDNDINEYKSNYQEVFVGCNDAVKGNIQVSEGVRLSFNNVKFGQNPPWMSRAETAAKKSYKHLIKGDIIVAFKSSNLHEITGYGVEKN